MNTLITAKEVHFDEQYLHVELADRLYTLYSH